MGNTLAILLMLAAQGTVGPRVELAPQRHFTRIVDTSARVPGHAVKFTGFRAAAVDGDRVAFHGENFIVVSGLYLADPAGLRTIVDTSTDIPSLPPGNPFVGFSDPSLADGVVAFLGARNVGFVDYEGILVGDGAVLVPIVERGDALSQYPGYFLGFLFPPALTRRGLSFRAVGLGPGPDLRGIFSVVGGLHTVADVFTPIPSGTGFFGGFCNPSASGDRTAFCGGALPGDPDGVYTDALGLTPTVAPGVVADKSTPVPGAPGNFTQFFDGTPFRGAEVVFRAGGPGGLLGVYSNRGGLHRVADTTTPIPGGTGTFTGFAEFTSYRGPAPNGAGRVAFLGEGSGGQRGIYVRGARGLRSAIAVGDELDGKTVAFVDLGSEGFDGSTLAFVAGFTDGSAGVYTLRLP